MISGAMDPVGGFSAGVNALAARYRALGVKDLTVKLYEGCRHELLNELNRDEVQAYILSWLDAHSAKRRGDRRQGDRGRGDGSLTSDKKGTLMAESTHRTG